MIPSIKCMATMNAVVKSTSSTIQKGPCGGAEAERRVGIARLVSKCCAGITSPWWRVWTSYKKAKKAAVRSYPPP
jgi:hypothetical protein